ncbi:MAG: alpha,alpha-trehalase [Vicinamibacteria bacterium]|nr:alpha,alpha-trehalase [Vicinamibacteria bacterium]
MALADRRKRLSPVLIGLVPAALALSSAPGVVARALTPVEAPQLTAPSSERLAPVREYIRKGWRTLTRSHADIPSAVEDPKVPHEPGTPWVVYVSFNENPEAVAETLAASLAPSQMERIRVARLPENPREHMDAIQPHGLLYLPHPYVVPGGRFNEMYGWDSYFIQVGLLRDGEIDLARNMADNFLYEIEHYGMILNANRTYYLTRSQPPFLTAMILGVYEKTRDRDWLAGTLPAVNRYYDYWTRPPHLLSDIGLSRYHGLGQGPAPEVVFGERDAQGRSHYDRVREYYASVPVGCYDLSLYYDARADALTPLFFVGDRAMRESGFDPSNRFGPFSVDIIHHAPVCLNALLYRMETEAAYICSILRLDAEAKVWSARSEVRRLLIDQCLWDQDAGLYRDYDVVHERQSEYEFATSFYPLWAGLASPEQARRVAANLYRFEAPGGVLTSTTMSGSQWDAPFGWAPIQLIVAQGLRRYGFARDADRISAKFLHLVTKEFEEHAVIVEKYDVVQRESDVVAGLRFGYATNEIGFGWTNAVFIELLAALGE